MPGTMGTRTSQNVKAYRYENAWPIESKALGRSGLGPFHVMPRRREPTPSDYYDDYEYYSYYSESPTPRPRRDRRRGDRDRGRGRPKRDHRSRSRRRGRDGRDGRDHGGGKGRGGKGGRPGPPEPRGPRGEPKRTPSRDGEPSNTYVWNQLVKREKARIERNFGEADRLRDALREKGIEIYDRERRWEAKDGRIGARPNHDDKEKDVPEDPPGKEEEED
eukprot:s1859_g10.t3